MRTDRTGGVPSLDAHDKCKQGLQRAWCVYCKPNSTARASDLYELQQCEDAKVSQQYGKGHQNGNNDSLSTMFKFTCEPSVPVRDDELECDADGKPKRYCAPFKSGFTEDRTQDLADFDAMKSWKLAHYTRKCVMARPNGWCADGKRPSFLAELSELATQGERAANDQRTRFADDLLRARFDEWTKTFAPNRRGALREAFFGSTRTQAEIADAFGVTLGDLKVTLCRLRRDLDEP